MDDSRILLHDHSSNNAILVSYNSPPTKEAKSLSKGQSSSLLISKNLLKDLVMWSLKRKQANGRIKSICLTKSEAPSPYCSTVVDIKRKGFEIVAGLQEQQRASDHTKRSNDSTTQQSRLRVWNKGNVKGSEGCCRSRTWVTCVQRASRCCGLVFKSNNKQLKNVPNTAHTHTPLLPRHLCFSPSFLHTAEQEG